LTFEDSIFDAPSVPINFDDLRLQYKDTKPGRRIAPRYQVTMEVIILTQNRSFRTTSINVSLSGALLKDPLPKEFMNCQALEIILIQSGQGQVNRLLFRGKAVGGPLSSARITFIEVTGNSQIELQRSFKNLEPLPAPF
jgi:hypothetical protein